VPNSIKAFIFFIITGSIGTFIGDGALSDLSLPLIWLSVIGGVICIMWFPFNFVKLKLAEERKAVYEEIMKKEKAEELKTEQKAE